MRLVRLLSAVLICVTLASCGGGDGTEDPGENAASPEAAATSEDVDAPEPTPSETEVVSCADEPPSKNVVTVVTPAFKFAPDTIKAPAGELVTVEYQNKDSAPHTFTIELLENLDCSLAPTGNQPLTGTFAMPEGTTKFYCAIHPSMTGKLIGT